MRLPTDFSINSLIIDEALKLCSDPKVVVLIFIYNILLLIKKQGQTLLFHSWKTIS